MLAQLGCSISCSLTNAALKLIVQPLMQPEVETPAYLGWVLGFFEEVIGS
jgi:hypothetical protein